MGWSQAKFAKEVGVSRGLAGQWESHVKKPGRDNLAKIAKATMVSMEYLTGDQTLEQISITVSDPAKIALLRQFEQLTPVQRENLRQLLGMSVEIRQEIEKHRGPVEGETVP